MKLRDIEDFVSTLHEPVAVTSVDGTFRACNDAIRSILRQYGHADATRLQEVVADTEEDVETYLRSCSRTRPAIQGSLTFANGERADKYTCYGGLLVRPDEECGPLLLLRFYRTQEAVRRFQLLGRKIDELNAEVRRRMEVEDKLREVQRELEARVAERTADLERTNRELLRSNQSLEEFAYVASHDLREPLRKISVFSEMLSAEASDELSDENLSILHRMTGAAQRMDTLIESLLEYSRVSISAEPHSTVDVGRVVREVVNDLEVLVLQSTARIETDDLPVVRADETQMRQLFQNLISNSLKFRRPDRDPVVRITARREDDTHVIELTDNGIGFQPEFADQIFDPFRRLNPRHEFEGTGIGLAVCRRIVERHGGRIRAEGRPGEGATFTIELPA